MVVFHKILSRFKIMFSHKLVLISTVIQLLHHEDPLSLMLSWNVLAENSMLLSNANNHREEKTFTGASQVNSKMWTIKTFPGETRVLLETCYLHFLKHLVLLIWEEGVVDQHCFLFWGKALQISWVVTAPRHSWSLCCLKISQLHFGVLCFIF